MKKLLIAAALAVACGPVISAELTAKDIYEACTNPLTGASLCNMFIHGAVSGIYLQAAATDTTPYLCENGLSMDRAREIFIGHMAKHPDAGDDPAISLFVDAISKLPCNS